MIAHKAAYEETKRVSALVLDHVNGRPELDEFRSWSPDLDGCRAAAAARTFDPASRRVLCDVIQEQYAGIALGDAVQESMNRLRSEGTLTVTTGHQLCILTGPLYVPFKILNVIRLARQLSNDLERPVVPVFWMASEDHDRPEIDHVQINGYRLQWTGPEGGPVGRMQLDGIGSVLRELRPLLGDSTEARELQDLLADSYRPERTLVDATRQFVHGLFGRFGLVCVDGDDPRTKQLFAEIMRSELIDQVTARSVAYADRKLMDRYPVQAHAREINLFHMTDNARRRIVPEEDRYRVIGGASFTLDELLTELDQHPGNFSPNVLMRPLYQETILPNVAYVGGGGELAYWLQLKWAFQAFNIPMPVILLRTGAAFISAKHLGQWKAMGGTLPDLFDEVESVKGRFARSKASFPTELVGEREKLSRLYEDLAQRVAKVDPSLIGAVEARRTQAMKGLDRLEKGLVRAAKREQGVIIERIERIHAALFPGGKLQERVESILPLIALRGHGVLDELLDALDPLDHRFTLFED